MGKSDLVFGEEVVEDRQDRILDGWEEGRGEGH